MSIVIAAAAPSHVLKPVLIVFDRMKVRNDDSIGESGGETGTKKMKEKWRKKRMIERGTAQGMMMRVTNEKQRRK